MPISRIALVLATVFVGSFSWTSVAGELKPVASVAMPCASEFQSISPTGEVASLHCTDDKVLLVNVSSGATLHSFASAPPVIATDYSSDGRWFAVLILTGM
jgi:hypothetical protein